jgi:hypothetical protein
MGDDRSKVRRRGDFDQDIAGSVAIKMNAATVTIAIVDFAGR